MKSNIVNKNWEEFWKDIVCYKNGKINVGRVKRELSDYREAMKSVSEVYCHITNGRISKINTCSHDVIAVADDIANEVDNE